MDSVRTRVTHSTSPSVVCVFNIMFLKPIKTQGVEEK